MADAIAELERGHNLYASEAWGDAFEALSAADRSDPLGADDLELLATSAYMIGREEDTSASSSAPIEPIGGGRSWQRFAAPSGWASPSPGVGRWAAPAAGSGAPSGCSIGRG